MLLLGIACGIWMDMIYLHEYAVTIHMSLSDFGCRDFRRSRARTIASPNRWSGKRGKSFPRRPKRTLPWKSLAARNRRGTNFLNPSDKTSAAVDRWFSTNDNQTSNVLDLLITYNQKLYIYIVDLLLWCPIVDPSLSSIINEISPIIYIYIYIHFIFRENIWK